MLKPNEIELFSMAFDEPMKELEMRIMQDIVRRIRILKCMLMTAKQLGLTSYGVDVNGIFGKGTLAAVNDLLKKWGYQANGIAGDKFIVRLSREIKNKIN